MRAVTDRASDRDVSNDHTASKSRQGLAGAARQTLALTITHSRTRQRQTMAKRRASRSASESEHEETPSKRARVEAEDNEDEVKDETVQDKDFEAKFSDKIRASIEHHSQSKGVSFNYTFN